MGLSYSERYAPLEMLASDRYWSQVLAEDWGKVSNPMLNPIPKSVHFLDYLNFGALFVIFLWSMCQNLCNIVLVV